MRQDCDICTKCKKEKHLDYFQDSLYIGLCDECSIKRKTILEFIELLNHNKKKIFINEFEDRTVNEIFLDMKFLRGLS